MKSGAASQALSALAPAPEAGHGRGEARTAKTVQLDVTEALALSRPAPHVSSHQHYKKQHQQQPQQQPAAEAAAGAPGGATAADAPRKLHRQKSGSKR